MPLRSFWLRQFSDINKEGWIAIWRKSKRFPSYIVRPFLVIIAIPLILILRLIRPLVWVRFGFFTVRRIGHFIFDVEFFLTEKKIGEQPEKTIDLFYFEEDQPANKQVEKMCRRILNIYPIARYFHRANKLIPFGSAHDILPAISKNRSRDLNGIFQKTDPCLKFSKDENDIAINFLKKIGCSQDRKFICLLVRDSAYLEKYHGPEIGLYHNFRDSDIDKYEDMALTFANKGYWVIRMGKVVHKPFKLEHSRILDYANSEYRSDFLDIWLMANCHFSISTSAGLDETSIVFRRPVVFVNHLPVGDFRAGSPNYIELFKLLRWKSTGEYLSLSEQITSGAILFYRKNDFEEKGIDIIDNTPQEINNAVSEMDRYLNGDWVGESIDAELQGRFWSIMNSWDKYNKYQSKIRPRISTSFLRENHEWFLA